jgi:hypothetical protein
MNGSVCVFFGGASAISLCFSVLVFCCLWQDNAAGLVLHGGGAMGSDPDADNESRSGSDNLDALSGGFEDEPEAEPSNGRKRKKKRYHRHTPQQIQELEA